MLLSRLRVGPKPKLPPGPRAATSTCLSLMMRRASVDARQLTIQLRARDQKPRRANAAQWRQSPLSDGPTATGKQDQAIRPEPGPGQVGFVQVHSRPKPQ
jgi:hypothetical protein